MPNFRENLSLLTLPQLVPQIGGTRQEEKRHPGPCKSGQPSPVQQARCGWVSNIHSRPECAWRRGTRQKT